MATTEATPVTTSPAAAPSAQVVGNAFVEHYYRILHTSPKLVHKFYQDSSVVSRPGPSGVMTSVTTISTINEMIISLDYNDYTAEIKTVDAQDSYEKGVVVLVTGCLTFKHNMEKKFTQSFFLAPQDRGYFVLNDVFRYVDESDLENTYMPVNETSESIPAATKTPDQELSHIPDPHVLEPTGPIVEEQFNNGEVEVYDPVDNEKESVVEEEAVEKLPVQSIQTEVSPIIEPVTSVVQEDAPKKSYASILKVAKSMGPTYVATNVSKPTATKPTATKPTTVAKPSSTVKPNTSAKVVPSTIEQQPLGSAIQAPAPEASVPSSNNASESVNAHEEVEGYSIYIKNLPVGANVEHVKEEFKKFGTIKPGGIQVRSNKGFSFGFVEFEALSSMQSAIEASSVTMGGRQVYIEEKKTTTRVGGRGRYTPGRGAYRNDFRGRGNNYGGGRGGYGRNDFGNRSDYQGGNRGDYYQGGNRGDNQGRRGPPSGRGGEGGGYQRVDQIGNARGGGRQGGMNQANQTVVSAA